MCSINILNLFLTIHKGFDEAINLKKLQGRQLRVWQSQTSAFIQSQDESLPFSQQNDD